MVSGSSTSIEPACAADLQRVHDHRVGVALVQLSEPGQAEHCRAVEYQDALHIGLQYAVEEGVEAAGELVEVGRCSLRGLG